MNPRHLLSSLALAAVLVVPTGAVAAKKTPKPVKGTFTFTGTPVDGGDEKYEKISIAFNLNRTDILGKDVKVTVAGRKAVKTSHVSTKIKGKKSDLYSAKLKESVRLAWSKTYDVTVQIKGGTVYKYRVKLDKPRL